MSAPTQARAGMQRAGGIAALYIAIAYLAAIPYFVFLVNYPGVVDPVQKVILLKDNYASMYWMHVASFEFVALALIVVTLAIHQRYSYLYAAVREAAGKRTMAGLVAHGWGNAFVPLFPTIIMAEGAAQQRYWIWAGLTLLAGVVAMIVRSRKALARFGALPAGKPR